MAKQGELARDPEQGKELEQHEPWWEPLIEFLTHTIAGTVIFLIVASAAIALDLLVSYLETVKFGEIGIQPLTLGVLTFAKYCILGVDVLLFLYFLVRKAWQAARKF